MDNVYDWITKGLQEVIEYQKSERDLKKSDWAEVVKCKDCRFYYKDEKWCERLGLCGAFNENDFCSHGERKKDNEAG